MKITNIELKKDKNDDNYLVVIYENSKGYLSVKTLNHYDLEHCLRNKISYEINKKKGDSK